MLSLHTNNAALSAQTAVGRTQSALTTSMTRLSTGYRINSAMDDAAGLQIATRLKAQSSGMAVAMRNSQNSTSMLQTAEGALSEVSNVLVRMKDLATQAADASSTKADRAAMQSEYDALASELSNIIGNTSFGGAKMMKLNATTAEATTATTPVAGLSTAASNAGTDLSTKQGLYTTAFNNYTTTPNDTNKGLMEAAKAAVDASAEAKIAADNAYALANSYATAATTSSSSTVNGTLASAVSFQIGSATAESMSLDISTKLGDMHAALRAVSGKYNSFGAAIGGVGAELTGNTVGAKIDALQTAIDSVGAIRSNLGAAANRLEHVHNNLANISTNTKAATGRIMDVDFASESASMTSNQMLLQAGTAMLKQSNSMSSMVMSLLQ